MTSRLTNNARRFGSMQSSGTLQLALLIAALSASLASPFSALATLFLLPGAAVAVSRMRTMGAVLWLMLGWLCWPPLTLFWSMAPGISAQYVAALLCLPLGWLVGQARGERLHRDLLYLLPSVLATLLAWGLWQGPETFTAKPQGPFNDPNVYAAALNLTVLPLLAVYLGWDLAQRARWQRTGLLALFAATAFVFFLVSSRGAMLALIVAAPMLFWLARKQAGFWRKSIHLFVVVISAFFAAYWVTEGLSLLKRVLDTVEGGDPARMMLAKSAWLMLVEQPWLGTGLGSFRLLYPRYRHPDEIGTAGGWVHNDYLQLWLEAGLPMLALLLILVVWTGKAIIRSLRSQTPGDLRSLGYLAGVAAMAVHATFNFLFYFPLIAMLLGLYIACVAHRKEPDSMAQSNQHDRARRFAVVGYSLLLALVLAGEVAIEALLVRAGSVQKILAATGIGYPRYEIAYWLSVLAPFHPSPSHAMGLELGGAYLLMGRQHNDMLQEAVDRLDQARRLAPCFLPFSNDTLEMIRQGPITPDLRKRGEDIAQHALVCNPRHGLSYYYAGRFAKTNIESARMWRAGIVASPYPAEQLLLTSALLSISHPDWKNSLASLHEQMITKLREHEWKPVLKWDPVVWNEVQARMARMATR